VAEERFFFDMPRGWAVIENVSETDYKEMVFVPFAERESKSISQYIRKITINKQKFDDSNSLSGRTAKMTSNCDDSKVLSLPSLNDKDEMGYSHEATMFWCVDKSKTERTFGAVKQITADDNVYILERVWRDKTKEIPAESYISKKETLTSESFQWAVVCNDTKQADSCNKMQQAYMASAQNKRQQAEIGKSASSY
jgi:hypothetical protein